MRVDAFDYRLPEELIALRPASPRDAARLLLVDPAATPAFADRTMLDLPSLLQPGDALVFNDTKVIPAELRGLRLRGGASAQIAVTLLEQLGRDHLGRLRRANCPAEAGRESSIARSAKAGVAADRPLVAAPRREGLPA